MGPGNHCPLTPPWAIPREGVVRIPPAADGRYRIGFCFPEEGQYHVVTGPDVKVVGAR